MSRTLAAALFAATFVGCHVFPDPPNGWEGDFNPEAVLDKVSAKLGLDATKEDEAKDFSATATVTHFEGEKPIEAGYSVRWKSPDRWSLEKAIGGQRVKRVFDGKTCTELTNGKVTKADLPPGEDGVDHLFRHLYATRYFREGRGSAPEIDEVFQLKEGGQAVRIGKFSPDGHRLVLSIDAKTLLPLAMREWVPVGPADQERFDAVDTFFSDYRADSRGILVPRTLRSWVGGKMIQEMKVADARWNTGITDAEFTTPAAAASPGR